MRLNVGLLLVLALVSLPVSATADFRRACSLQRLQYCADTNQLTSDKQFWREVRRFVGARRGDYITRGESVYQQFGDILGGPPDDRRMIDGVDVFGAAQFKAGFIKGAAILNPDGSVYALAFVSPCGHPDPVPFCSEKYTLTVFSRTPIEKTPFGRDIQKWASDEILNTMIVPGEKSRLAFVNFLVLN